ncbi:MAG: Hpt domain-containing protein [Pseudobdellovibrio sp.]
MSLINNEHIQQLLEVGGPELVTELMNIFLKEAPGHIDRLKSFDVSKHQKEIGEFAHKMKSSSASLGLISMSKHCATIEKKARSGQAVGQSDMLQIIDYIRKAQTELEVYLKAS